MNELLEHANLGGGLRFGTKEEDRRSAEQIKDMMQLIVATLEYQLA